MKRAGIILASLLMAVGIVAVPSTAHAVDDSLYSFRACEKYGRLIGGQGNVCLKVYARRQSDGNGFTLNSVHIYAWTTTESTSRCGSFFANPAVSDPSEAVVYGADDNRAWSGSQPLNDATNCDAIWGSDPGPYLKFNGDHVTINYFERPHIENQPDPAAFKIHIRLYYNGDGGIAWACNAESGDGCERQAA